MIFIVAFCAKNVDFVGYISKFKKYKMFEKVMFLTM